MKKCTKCLIEKPFADFCKTKHSKDGFNYQCKQCINAASRAKYALSPRDFSVNFEQRRNYQLKKNYGIDAIRYNEMLTEQNFGCGVCGIKTDLVVDHDHNTGQVRALLCHKCNKGLGFFKDSEELMHKGIVYLRFHKHIKAV